MNSIGKKLLEIIRSFPVSSPVGWDQAAAEHKRAEAERLRLEVVFGLDGKKTALMSSLKANEADEVGYLPDFCWG